MLKDVPPGLSPSERAKRMASALNNIDSLERLNLNRWRQIIIIKLTFGIVAGIFQVISLTKLIADDEKALASLSDDATAYVHWYGGSGIYCRRRSRRPC